MGIKMRVEDVPLWCHLLAGASFWQPAREMRAFFKLFIVEYEQKTKMFIFYIAKKSVSSGVQGL